MAKSVAARRLKELLYQADDDMSTGAFQQQHSELFDQMEKDGINATAFWMRITSNRDVETGK